MSEYNKINSFEDIIELSKSEIETEYKMNFNIKVNFDINLIQNSIEDVHNLALDFQNPECPDNLHMNHGMYIHSDGIDNVISELKNKKNSNRAIISLINQKDIIGSGDNPIPSFMILQFSIENNEQLYVTVYFRALEVSTFLRVNIEEIRIIIQSIHNNFIDLKNVSLNIISFRAYIRENISILERAKLDQLTQIKILGKLKKEPTELIELIQKKMKTSTVIEYESFKTILECITDDDSKKDINIAYTKPLIITILKEIIKISKELKINREKSSHSIQIDEYQKQYKTKLTELIKVIRNDD